MADDEWLTCRSLPLWVLTRAESSSGGDDDVSLFDLL